LAGLYQRAGLDQTSSQYAVKGRNRALMLYRQLGIGESGFGQA
jgi:hypothetical protein